MKHVRALDGMRAVAVLSVLLFHAGLFHPGWIGVQVFFTLSGYLITTNLLAAKEARFGSYIGRFFWRRSLRIFPVYVFFVLVAGVSYRWFGEPASFKSDWPYLVTFTANFARIRAGDVGQMFVHFWSLAVEEQFYWLWPFLIYALPERAFKIVIAALLVLSPAVRLALFAALRHAGQDPTYAGRLAYVLPFTQLDAFAAGASIPLWNLDRSPRGRVFLLEAVALAGAAGATNMLISHFCRGGADVWAFGYPMYMIGGYQYVWGYSLLNVVSALGIICLVQTPVRFLEHAALVRVGKISYGIYVYHPPLYALVQWWFPGLGVETNWTSKGLFFLVYVSVVLLVAEISFRFLEMPFLRMKNRWPSGPRANRAPAAS